MLHKRFGFSRPANISFPGRCHVVNAPPQICLTAPEPKFTLFVTEKWGCMNAIQGQPVATRPCAYCGKPVPSRMNRCPYCREEVPEVRLSAPTGKNGRREVRRGLIYMLLGAVIYYFAGGYSALSLPFPLNPWVTTYLAPIVFLGGLGMWLYGLFLRMRS
jgi:hypothetical protein